MKNILIITYSFPPSNSIGSKRFGEMAMYFKEYGYTPWILTTEIKGDIPSFIPENQVIRIGRYSNGGYISESGLIPKIFTFLYASFAYIGIKSIFLNHEMLWYYTVRRNFGRIKDRIPKVAAVISTYGPTSSTLIGRYLSTKFSAPWIADYRDLGALSINNINWKTFDIFLEKLLINKTHALTTVSKTLADILEDQYNKKCHVIYNGWDNVITSNLNNSTHSQTKKYLYYAGRIYLHRIESIKLLLTTMVTKPDINLMIRILNYDEMKNKLTTLAKEMNVSSRIDILEPTTYETCLEESNHSLANIVCEDMDSATSHSKGTITGKFMQLLPLAPPILAIARADSEIGEILKKTKKGELCSTSDSIVQFLKTIKESRLQYSGDEHEIQFYSRKEQAKRLCQILDQCIT